MQIIARIHANKQTETDINALNLRNAFESQLGAGKIYTKVDSLRRE